MMKTPSFWIKFGIVFIATVFLFGMRKTELEPLSIHTLYIDNNETFVVWAHNFDNTPRVIKSADSYTIDELLKLLPVRSINEPTFVQFKDHEDKKALRAGIDKAVSRESRRMTLRNLMPTIIAPCSVETSSVAPNSDLPYLSHLKSTTEQAFADLEYYKDTYGGVAWTEPPNCPAVETKKYRELVAAVFYRVKSWWEIW